MSKEQNRAFIRGRQVRLDAERLLLVEKTKASILGAVSVGWKNRMGKVVFKQASMALRGGTALFDICRDGNKLYSVAVPLEGSDFIMESSNVIQFRTHEGTNYLWVRFEEQEVLKEWLTGLLAATKSEVSLNDFTIIRAVGKGGMGKVFFAKHKRTDERLALKVSCRQCSPFESFSDIKCLCLYSVLSRVVRLLHELVVVPYAVC